MARALTDENLDAEVETAFEWARTNGSDLEILSAVYHPEKGMEFLEMKLSDGRRLLIPKEELGELDNATPEQAQDVVVLPPGASIYWPQLDDGLSLGDFLEHRWRREPEAVAA